VQQMEKTFTINTKNKQEVIDITSQIKEIIKQSNVNSGICVVYVAHATASIIINENDDPEINNDFLEALSKLIPQGKWRHDRLDGNADAHIKAAITGSSRTLIIKDNKPILGTWQNIMLADFDGLKQRTITVKIIKG